MKGIVFYGSGGLFFYYLGIADYIQTHYDVSGLEFCGVSGGGFPAALLASNIEIKYVWNAVIYPWIKEMSHSNHISPVFDEISINNLKKYMNANVPKSALSRINSSLSIRMSQVHLFGHKQFYKKSWNSINDLIDCVVASCWIPGVFGSLTKEYKNNHYIDGGWPKSIENRGPEWLKIKIDTFQNMHPHINKLLFWSSIMTVHDDKLALKLYDLGYKDAKNNNNYFKMLHKK